MTSVRFMGAFAAVGLLMLPWGTQAQTLSPEGPLSVTFTSTQMPPAKPMPIGGGKEFVLANSAMAASNDAGNPVLNNMGGRCQLARTIDTAANTVETHGYCAYTDAAGDQIFEKCDFLPGAPNKCELTGGTGKFEGLQASIIITTEVVKSNYEGILQIVGHKKGTYKIVKTH
jgi:hypothetical protein